jgi:hypothetical protein
LSVLKNCCLTHYVVIHLCRIHSLLYYYAQASAKKNGKAKASSSPTAASRSGNNSDAGSDNDNGNDNDDDDDDDQLQQVEDDVEVEPVSFEVLWTEQREDIALGPLKAQLYGCLSAVQADR